MLLIKRAPKQNKVSKTGHSVILRFGELEATITVLEHRRGLVKLGIEADPRVAIERDDMNRSDND